MYFGVCLVYCAEAVQNEAADADRRFSSGKKTENRVDNVWSINTGKEYHEEKSG